MKTKNLTVIYIVALTIIAIVIGVSQYLVQASLSSSLYDSRTINISGRQAMLSQRISKAALMMETSTSPRELDSAKIILAEATELWESSHNALQYGSAEMQLNDVNNSDKTLMLFLQIEPHYVSIRQAVYQLLQAELRDSLKIQTYADVILENEPQFLTLMEAITLDYDNESRARLDALSRQEYFLVGVALLLLVLEGVLIFRPMIRRVIDYTDKLIRQEGVLKKALKLQKLEQAKVKLLNKQAEAVFANVRQGLFLLDRSFSISELHSKALEEILYKENLGGASFLEIMRPRLVKRDQEALEMFVAQLFNPDIKPRVLTKLNPLSEVEIFYDHDTSEVKSRFIRTNFSRIQNGDDILLVLVSITDVTDSVRLRQQIQETEERNEKESAQLLSILSVEPLALRDFLYETETALYGISAKYERDRLASPRRLIQDTYKIIHNLKGNAALIEIHLIADRLHQIEELISEIKLKENVGTNDFLKILYEIRDLGEVIDNMQRMLRRVVEVNEKLKSGEEIGSYSQNLLRNLNTGLSNICDEVGKKAILNLKDNGVKIPERHRLAIKDTLIQLFRNSLAHGIEDPEGRIRAGKQEVASISVRFAKMEDFLVIDYRDDGAGLDKDKIVGSAIAKSIIKLDDAIGLDEQGLVDLIFRDDFTTSDEVDHLSGRGQGMGLVKSIIEKQNGTFEVSSRAGEYFRFQFQLPFEHTLVEV